MKTTTKFILSSFILLCIEVHAQEKAEIPSEKTIKGRSELRKDERVKQHKEKSDKTNKKKLEKQADKPFIKKEHPKKLKRKEEVIRK